MASFDYHILVEGIMVDHELSLIEMETIINKTIKRKVDTVNDNQLCGCHYCTPTCILLVYIHKRILNQTVKLQIEFVWLIISQLGFY